MARLLLPLYRWRCLHCRTFPRRSQWTEFTDFYGCTLRICHTCQHPLALVKVKWMFEKKNPA